MGADAALPQCLSNKGSHNLEAVLNTNIEASKYYAQLHTLEFDGLVDEIYNEARSSKPLPCSKPAPAANLAAHAPAPAPRPLPGRRR